MKTALFISPHLDDVAFSCGGVFARRAAEKWRTILCTIFTRSVACPTNFALACQTDKDLSPDVDYMRLRRAEDFRAAQILGAGEILHLNFLEAPHRGYESAAELFAGVKPGDEIWKLVAEQLKLVDETLRPEMIFAPQGLGNHADHLQTIRAARAAFPSEKTIWYRDTPYAVRQPSASPSDLLPSDLTEIFYDINSYLTKKILACAAYESQINFQFGNLEQLKTTLESFHQAEAARLQTNSPVIETFLSSAPA